MRQRFGESLKKLNLKVTSRRLAVLEAMMDESTFLSPDEIWKKVRTKLPNVGLPTVYRILEELVEGGMITRILHDDRQLYYYCCPNRNHHHHFVCVSCRRVEDVEVCLEEALEQEVSQRIKGTLFSHILQLQGLCERCRKKEDQR
ncbi:MAG: Peroxide operon regulator [Syntrophorhabdaceae bacterium PtaU1.Bin034]|nr:MAG: Peroxide operon regulator [Syntrophorhabdaceae bacterium PtaU1.Bin034]